MKNRQDYEIMAPVGSYDSLAAAIQGGADSIYFGIEGLNMRAKSSNNFTVVDLKNIVKICKENNMKSYLTVNTIIYDNDIVEQQIKGPKGELIRIEMFSHGALCMAVSGKCYLSLHEKDLSANRGACNQICRRGYIVKEKETDIELEIDNQYIMSPKDLKTIHFMNKMLDAGVRVFKIEGRARGPEYVRTVVECYREGIESYCEGTFSEEKITDWDKRLATVFNRGFWDGYYLGQRLGEWSSNYGSGATKRKVYVGKGITYYSKLGVAEFQLEAQALKKGDEILVTGPTTGAIYHTLDEIQMEHETVNEINKGDRFAIKFPEKIRPGDKLFKIITVQQKKRFVERERTDEASGSAPH